MHKYPTNYRQARILAILCSVFPAVFLTGCGEVLNEYYLSNHTDMDVTIRMVPDWADNVSLRSGPLVEGFEDSIAEDLKSALPFSQNDENTEFVIPPRTTVLLGFSTGGNDLFTELEINQGSNELLISDSNIRSYFDVFDDLRGAIVWVFDIK